MIEKLSTNGAVFLTGMSAEWVRKNLPHEYIGVGQGGRRIRVFDKGAVEKFMKDRKAAKALKNGVDSPTAA